MSVNEAGFANDESLVRWVASQFPNLPHIQTALKYVADRLERVSKEAAEGLVAEVKEVESAVGNATGKAIVDSK